MLSASRQQCAVTTESAAVVAVSTEGTLDIVPVLLRRSIRFDPEEATFVLELYSWLGVDVDLAKCPRGSRFHQLGIPYNLAEGMLGNRAGRKAILFAEIDAWLGSRRKSFVLSPHTSAEGTELSEREFTSSRSEHKQNRHLRICLLAAHPESMPQRTVCNFDVSPSDVVTFTDDSHPDPRVQVPQSPPRVGRVVFERGAADNQRQVHYSL